MKKIRTLKLKFDLPLEKRQTPLLRGAIASKVGLKHDLFHNHPTEAEAKTDYLYRYPLIQYKTFFDKAGVFCLEDGTVEIHKLLSAEDWRIKLGQEEVELKIEDLDMNLFTCQVWQHKFTYKIFAWLPLNSKNFEDYTRTESLAKRMAMLERILIAHILNFAEGVKWNVDQRIELDIVEVHKERTLYYKEIGFKAFDLVFKTNVSLPSQVGLGKASSAGFGVIRPWKIKREEQRRRARVGEVEPDSF